MTDTPLLAVGQVATSEGLIHQQDGLGRVVEVMWCPAVNYLRHQPPARVTMDHDDDWVVGRVVAYDRSRRWGLLAALLLRGGHEDYINGAYLSPKLHTVGLDEDMRRERGQILELSIVAAPGNVGTKPLRSAPLNASISPLGLPWGWEDFWDASKEQATMAPYRPAPKRIEIDDRDPLDAVDVWMTDPEGEARKARIMARAEALTAEDRVSKARAAREAQRDDPGVVRRRTFGGSQLTWVH